MSDSQWSRLERGGIARPTVDQLCRAARAVGLAPSMRVFPTGARLNDAGQLPLLARLEAMLARPLVMRREVGIRIPGDLRAWDARITDGRLTASTDAEARVGDIQALARRTALKQRDDPEAGVVFLVLNRTAHNRSVLAEHREALRAQFPLDGAAIARALRRGIVPPAGGIILV
jgi:transcriptional regulator with XRE-family HTH domain